MPADSGRFRRSQPSYSRTEGRCRECDWTAFDNRSQKRMAEHVAHQHVRQSIKRHITQTGHEVEMRTVRTILYGPRVLPPGPEPAP